MIQLFPKNDLKISILTTLIDPTLLTFVAFMLDRTSLRNNLELRKFEY